MIAIRRTDSGETEAIIGGRWTWVPRDLVNELDRLRADNEALKECLKTEIRRLQGHNEALEAALAAKTSELYPDLRAELAACRDDRDEWKSRAITGDDWRRQADAEREGLEAELAACRAALEEIDRLDREHDYFNAPCGGYLRQKRYAALRAAPAPAAPYDPREWGDPLSHMSNVAASSVER